MNDVRAGSAIADPVSFYAEEVTGQRSVSVEMDGHRMVADVAASLAAMLDLPPNTPYGLRDDDRARMLIDNEPIGKQVPQTGARLVCIPRSQLG